MIQCVYDWILHNRWIVKSLWLLFIAMMSHQWLLCYVLSSWFPRHLIAKLSITQLDTTYWCLQALSRIIYFWSVSQPQITWTVMCLFNTLALTKKRSEILSLFHCCWHCEINMLCYFSVRSQPNAHCLNEQQPRGCADFVRSRSDRHHWHRRCKNVVTHGVVADVVIMTAADLYSYRMAIHTITLLQWRERFRFGEHWTISQHFGNVLHSFYKIKWVNQNQYDENLCAVCWQSCSNPATFRWGSLPSVLRLHMDIKTWSNIYWRILMLVINNTDYCCNYPIMWVVRCDTVFFLFFC